MDDVGKRLLRSISKQSEFPVITKPSNISRYGETVIHQKNRANIADSVYMLTLGASASADHAITFTPYVKK